MSNPLVLLLAVFICIPLVIGEYNQTLENEFLQNVSANQTREYLLYYTSEPHLAGSIQDFDQALWTQARFQEFGINATIDSYEVLFSTPLKRVVEIVYPQNELFACVMKEPAIAEDPTSNHSQIVDTYNGFSASGNVTAELVYVNYGRIEDFEQLMAANISVVGKIVIARYGQNFRGVKALLAQIYGAVGLLIYSDPADDGYGRGATYPDGPWRPAEGVQRGSVQFSQICPGDVRRTQICLGDANAPYVGTIIPEIPVQPLSWADAMPLLRGITNTPATWPGWSGGLNMTYHIGPGPVQVHLELDMLYNVTTIYNVIATINGVHNDQSVILGNHRDAWVFGAADPSSGTAALLEVARGFGLLMAQGWKPQRKIIFGSWDGEEQGLTGSTSYAERYATQLSQEAIAYINVDVAVGSGMSFDASGTSTLEEIIRGVAASVPHPTSGTIADHWNLPYSNLGSGSDFVAFLHHLGIASVDMSFQSDTSGVYHSIYDSFHWMEKFMDPNFAYHKAMAQIFGLVALRISEADVLPFNYTAYTNRLYNYTQTTQMLLEQYNATNWVSLASISNSLNSLYAQTLKVGQEQAQVINETNPSPSTVAALNSKLVMSERQFLIPEGLPYRPWYKHAIQAPGIYKGYSFDVFPGLTQAILEGEWELAQQQANAVASRINAVTASLAGMTPPNPNNDNNRTIIIIAIVVPLGVAIIAVVSYFLYRRRRDSYAPIGGQRR